LEAVARSLVGRRVIRWEWLARRGLRVAFAGGVELTVAPWPASEDVADAWSLESPDGQLVAVSTGGQVVVVSARVPVGDWFDAAV
jgi:hypothetical protein